MLSPTEIHYVAGFLYLARGGEVTVILGEKVSDSASESARDVDIVIATAGQTCFTGIEVKQEGRQP